VEGSEGGNEYCNRGRIIQDKKFKPALAMTPGAVVFVLVAEEGFLVGCQ